MLSGTILFYIYLCFSVLESFGDGSLANIDWWQVRSLLVLCSMALDVPITITVRYMFRWNERRLLRRVARGVVIAGLGAGGTGRNGDGHGDSEEKKVEADKAGSGLATDRSSRNQPPQLGRGLPPLASTFCHGRYALRR